MTQQHIGFRRPQNTYSVNTNQKTKGITRISGGEQAYPMEPIVLYTPVVKAQMDFLVSKCHQEVGWLGLVKNPRDGVYLIYKIIVPEQEVTNTETDIDGDALAIAALELIEEGYDTGELYAWFHSHVNMGVSPSGQDEDQVEEFLETCPVFIRGIVNKRGESKVDVYYRDWGIAYNCVDTDTQFDFEIDPCAGLDDIIKERVKTRSRFRTDQNQRQDKKANTAGKRLNPAAKSDKNKDDNSDKATAAGGPTLDTIEYDDNDLTLQLDYPTVDTGYNGLWDETTPLKDRPEGWKLDTGYMASDMWDFYAEMPSLNQEFLEQ